MRLQTRFIFDFRYFECKPLYGLFAPVHKVTKQGIVAPPTPSGRATPSLSQQKMSSLRMSSVSSAGLTARSRDLSGSQESLNSISSAISSTSRSRVRLGVTSLAKRTDTAQVHSMQSARHFHPPPPQMMPPFYLSAFVFCTQIEICYHCPPE